MDIIIYAYLILGFVLIIVAPVWKLFKKAGKSGWTALIPAYNILEFGRTHNLSPYLIAVPMMGIMCIFGMFFLIGIIQIEVSFLFFLLLVLQLAFVFGVLTIFFFYPFLSLTMCVMLSFFHQYISPELGILKIIFLVLIVLELAVEIMYWLAVFKKLNRPLWQLVFLLIPLVPIAGIYVLTEFAIALQLVGSIIVGISVFVTLFAALSYLYYLGYSLKVKYAE
ncbi:MAG: hypothetical protein JW822_10675 [Spirochaetales bacterium]|nr:hypothetical protein [Spirochaetales bacterium]